MKKIYIDSEFKCHVIDDGTMTAVEHSFFNDKCDVFIEGYRFIPLDKSWTNDDGIVFYGEMITPFKDQEELYIAQRAYEKRMLMEYEAALAEIENALGV